MNRHRHRSSSTIYILTPFLLPRLLLVLPLPTYSFSFSLSSSSTFSYSSSSSICSFTSYCFCSFFSSTLFQFFLLFPVPIPLRLSNFLAFLLFFLFLLLLFFPSCPPVDPHFLPTLFLTSPAPSLWLPPLALSAWRRSGVRPEALWQAASTFHYSY